MMVVDDVLEALARLAEAARARSKATGSSPSPAASARRPPRRRCAMALPPSGKVHASAASFNNHWGVPLTLARMPRDARFGDLRDRHEPSRRDPAAGQDGAAASWRSSPLIAPAHLGHFRDLDEIAGPRPRSSRGWSAAAPRCSIATIRNAACWRPWPARPASTMIRTFGESAGADFRLLSFAADRRAFGDRKRRSAARPFASSSTVPRPAHGAERARRSRRGVAGRCRSRQGRRRADRTAGRQGRGGRDRLPMPAAAMSS